MATQLKRFEPWVGWCFSLRPSTFEVVKPNCPGLRQEGTSRSPRCWGWRYRHAKWTKKPHGVLLHFDQLSLSRFPFLFQLWFSSKNPFRKALHFPRSVWWDHSKRCSRGGFPYVIRDERCLPNGTGGSQDLPPISFHQLEQAKIVTPFSFEEDSEFANPDFNKFRWKEFSCSKAAIPWCNVLVSWFG